MYSISTITRKTKSEIMTQMNNTSTKGSEIPEKCIKEREVKIQNGLAESY